MLNRTVSTSLAYLAILLLVAAAAIPVQSFSARPDGFSEDVNWDVRFARPGVESLQTHTTVRAVAVSGSNIYVGGVFNRAGGIDANGVALWDGATWTALGGGLRNENFAVEVRAIAVKGTDVYVGGEFVTADGIKVNNIAKWDGAKWSALGGGIPLGCFSCRPTVTAIVVSGDDVYVGGNFTSAGGVSATNVAKWDGSRWSALGGGVGDDSFRTVTSLAVSGSGLYAGGSFGIARWDGASWSALGGGLDGQVSALAVKGSDLYVGGSLNYLKTPDRFELTHFAKWDGARWSVPSTDVEGFVLTLAVVGADVYAGGVFASAGDVRVNSIARWDGARWSALDSGVHYPFDDRVVDVYCLTVSGGDLYVGGDFGLAGALAANQLAKWDGAGWSVFSKGLSSGPLAIAINGNDVYVGGPQYAAGVAVNYIARWDGASWAGLGGGLNREVRAIAVSGSNLYAGGDFTVAGGGSANHIARWDGVGWSALGGGLNGNVTALAVSGNNVYAGGTFTRAGDVDANGIARWDGAKWSALGVGISGCGGFTCAAAVLAMVADGDDVYVAGSFSSAGPELANGIARWDGSRWHGLGAGMDGPVNTIALYDGDLYAGGSFNRAGGVFVKGPARWDGQAWSAVGGGLDGPAYGLASNGVDLYATGIFHVPGAADSSNIAKWNGRTWSPLGTGVSFGQFQGSGSTVACDGSAVYVGGAFSVAGGKASTGFARWSIPINQSTRPVIAAASVAGKKLFVNGSNFDLGAIVLINGQRQKTLNDADDPRARLIAKKAGKKINAGDKIQVRNADGGLSPEFVFAAR